MSNAVSDVSLGKTPRYGDCAYTLLLTRLRLSWLSKAADSLPLVVFHRSLGAMVTQKNTSGYNDK